MREQDRALLISRLYVPIVIRDILERPGKMDDDIGYSLHELISDYRPDSALLAIALSTGLLLKASQSKSPNTGTLNIACERAIEEYGPFWLDNCHNEAVSERFVLDNLEAIAEDLESLSDLLGVLVSAESNPKTGKLLNVVQVQAQAHADIANEFINLMDGDCIQSENRLESTPGSNDNGRSIAAFPNES